MMLLLQLLKIVEPFLVASYIAAFFEVATAAAAAIAIASIANWRFIEEVP